MSTPGDSETVVPPSAARLFRSTLAAVAVAAALLLTIVLPAEYGVDPTGVGGVLGLTQMGEIKVALARELAAEDAAAAEEAAADELAVAAVAPAVEPAASAVQAPAEGTDSGWTDVTIVNLAPGEGKEVKLEMRKGARATFDWAAVGGVVNHDTHGDSTGAPKSYIGYRKATGVAADAGELVAPMDGHHGWFWRNRGTAPVSITLRTRGDYAVLKKMY